LSNYTIIHGQSFISFTGFKIEKGVVSKTPAIEGIGGEERKWKIFVVVSSKCSVKGPPLQV